MEFDVVGIGDLCLDIIAATDRIPQTDMVSPLLYATTQGGGKIPTALVALSRLGGRGTLFCTVGNDAAGRFCRQELYDAGVDTRHMVVLDDKQTNISFCIAEEQTGGRSFIGKYDMRSVLPEELDKSTIEKAKLLHLWSASPAAIMAAKWIHEAGGKVVFDADRYSRNIEEHIGMTDVFICSEFFLNGFCVDTEGREDREKCLREITSVGPEIAIVTLGAKGYAGVDGTGYFEGPAYGGIHVVDSTGAGDVFHGAFLYGLLQRWDARKTAQFASAVSAVKCTTVGGRAGIPDVATVEKFMKTGEIDTEIQQKWLTYYRDHGML